MLYLVNTQVWGDILVLFILYGVTDVYRTGQSEVLLNIAQIGKRNLHC